MNIHTKLTPIIPYSLSVAAHKSLRQLTSKDGKGVYASGGLLFRGAVFGRDSLEVAEDVYVLRPRLVRKVIVTLAALQGTRYDPQSEEEPGKIPHEHRTRTIGGRPLTTDEQYVYEQLAKHWGERDGTLTYYGSVDATPLFVRLVCKYVRIHGTAILRRHVTRGDEETVSVRKVLEDAVRWIRQSITTSDLGMLGYMRKNPHGLEHQAWKDSLEFFRHSDGTPSNMHAPIAAIEVQGLAYDALVFAADILQQPQLIQLAQLLQQKVLDELWIPSVNYFALGLDHDPDSGRPRQIKTITANPAELLDTSIFDNLADADKERYVGGIVRRIFGAEFLTDAGVRSRSLAEKGIVTFWDYHGSNVTWPKETFDIARGLRRQNLPQLARQLEYRLLNIARRTKGFYEFYYVSDDGKVLLNYVESVDRLADFTIKANNPPMDDQAWTVSAIMALRSPSRIPTIRLQKAWQKRLEKDTLKAISTMRQLRTTRLLEDIYPTYTYRLDKQNSWIDQR